MTDYGEILLLVEAAEYTGYKIATLRWRRSMNLPPISRKRAGRVVYLKSDLDDWMQRELDGDVRGDRIDPHDR